MLKFFQAVSQNNLYVQLNRFLPTIIIVALAYFGYSYLQAMQATVEATKQQSVLLQEQLVEIKAANKAIAEDMKGVKELTDTFNTQLTHIRSNQNQLTNVVRSQKFKGDVANNVPAAQESLNQSFNKMFSNINGVTNAK